MNTSYLSRLNIFIAAVFAAQLLLILAPPIGAPAVAALLGATVLFAMRSAELSSIMLSLAILLASELAGLVTGGSVSIGPVVVQYAVIYGLGLFYWLRFEPHRHHPRPVSFHLLYLPVMIVIGISLGYLGFLERGSIPLIPAVKTPLLLYIPFFALAEELLFRRMILHEVSRHAGIAAGVVASVWLSMTFQASTDLTALGFVILSSFAISTIYAVERNLFYPVVINIVMKYTFVILLIKMG